MFWFAVHTKPKSEDFAALQLAQKGFEVFLPKIEVTRKRGTKRFALVVPLFPGYLFIRLAPALPAVRQVNWTPGVKYLLCAGETPVPVPEEAIDLIRQRTGPRGHITPGAQAQFPPGTRVAVRFGPFAGLVGVVERPVPGRSRIRVLLDLLQRQTPLELDPVDLDRLAGAPGKQTRAKVRR
jgi:transcriptional antiterminator RfaH